MPKFLSHELLKALDGSPVVESVGHVRTVVTKRSNAVEIDQFVIGVEIPVLPAFMAIERKRRR